MRILSANLIKSYRLQYQSLGNYGNLFWDAVWNTYDLNYHKLLFLLGEFWKIPFGGNLIQWPCSIYRTCFLLSETFSIITSPFQSLDSQTVCWFENYLEILHTNILWNISWGQFFHPQPLRFNKHNYAKLRRVTS